MHDIDFTDAFCGRLFFAHMLGRNNHGGGNKFSSCSFCGGEWRVVNGKCRMATANKDSKQSQSACNPARI